ncbi:MAG: porin family protein [Bacteroidota bacterium]
MRKTIILLLFACALSSVYAQKRPWRIGIKGGINYIHVENYGKGYYSDFDPKMGWTFGALFQYTKGGFLNYSIVPEILYTQSKTNADLLYITDCMTTIHSIDVPVSFKLGLQLSKIFRPYILASIYGSYVVSYDGELFYTGDNEESIYKYNIGKVYFGLGAGMGFDIWKFQLEGRYRWNLNRINSEYFSALKQMGLELTCAFLF